MLNWRGGRNLAWSVRIAYHRAAPENQTNLRMHSWGREEQYLRRAGRFHPSQSRGSAARRGSGPRLTRRPTSPPDRQVQRRPGRLRMPSGKSPGALDAGSGRQGAWQRYE
jgi:hypothetical protein